MSNENEPRVPAGNPGGGQWTGQYGGIADRAISQAETLMKTGKSVPQSFERPGLSDGRNSYGGGRQEYVTSPDVAAKSQLKEAYSNITRTMHSNGHAVIGHEGYKAANAAQDKLEEAATRLKLGEL